MVGRYDRQVDVAALYRGLRQRAAARQRVFSRAEPEGSSADYRAGFGAGCESGYVSALALALSIITGASHTSLIEDTRVNTWP